jgi:MSHA biogenesis protein MshQ
VPQFTTACTAGAFTYMGQAFGYTTAPVLTVTAKAAAGVGNTTTQNYTGAFWKITNTSLTGRSYAAGTGTLDTGGLPGTATDPAIADLGNGVGTLTFNAGTGLAFQRGLAPIAAFDAEIKLAINVIDDDNIIYTANPAAFGDTTPGNGIAFSAGKAMRWGRLATNSVYGSELLDLPVPLTAQYWVDLDGAGAGTDEGFITHTADVCTGIAAGNVMISPGTDPLTPADTALVVASNPFVGGSWHTTPAGPYTRLTAPGAGKHGSVNLEIDLSGAGLTWLQYDWDGVDQLSDANLFDDNPSALATFGVYQGNERGIFLRELY